MKNRFKLFAIWVALAGGLYACDKDENTPPVTPPAPGGTGTTKSSAKAITKFSFVALSPAVEGAVSGTSITATVPGGTDLTKLAPAITVSDKATVSPASGVTRDFSKEITYTVTAEDGSAQTYKITVTKAGGSSGFTGDNLIYYYYRKTDFSSSKPTFEYYIKAYNGSTGKESGAVSLGSSKEGDGTYESDYYAYPVLFNNGVLFAARKGKMLALEVSTGKTKWTAGLNNYDPNSFNGETKHTVDNGVLFATGFGSKTIYALNESDGNKKWTFDHNETINTLTAVNGVLYAGYGDVNYSGGLLAIEVSTGKQKWNMKTIGVSSNPAVVNGVVYYGDFKNKVFAVDAATGTKKWEFVTGGMVTGSPTLTDGVVYISSEDRKVYALDATTGVKKWDFTAPGKYAINLTGDATTLFVVADNNSKKTFYALDKKTGAKKWEITPSFSFTDAMPVVAGGVLYFDKYAFDAATGTDKNLGIAGTGYSLSSPCVVSGGKYMGSNSSGMMQ